MYLCLAWNYVHQADLELIEIYLTLPQKSGIRVWVSTMVKALATKPVSLSSISGTHRVEGENQHLQVPSQQHKICKM